MNSYPLPRIKVFDILAATFFVASGFLLTQGFVAAWRVPVYETHPSTSQTSQGQAPAQMGSSTRASLNWSGYVAEGGSYTSVSGSWVVPQVDTTNNPSLMADATWVGIGGVAERDLIQAGTQAITDASGDIIYQPWIETIPGDSSVVPFEVRPGDSVNVSITQQSPDMWLISLKDATTGGAYQTTMNFHSSLSSAEWIEEMPSAATGNFFIPLDKFGTVSFTSGSTVDNGTTKSIAQSGARALTMTSVLGETLATASDLGADGSSFSVARSSASANIAVRRHGLHVTYYFTHEQ